MRCVCVWGGENIVESLFNSPFQFYVLSRASKSYHPGCLNPQEDSGNQMDPLISLGGPF